MEKRKKGITHRKEKSIYKGTKAGDRVVHEKMCKEKSLRRR
jgi:hypothetical protein